MFFCSSILLATAVTVSEYQTGSRFYSLVWLWSGSQHHPSFWSEENVLSPPLCKTSCSSLRFVFLDIKFYLKVYISSTVHFTRKWRLKDGGCRFHTLSLMCQIDRDSQNWLKRIKLSFKFMTFDWSNLATMDLYNICDHKHYCSISFLLSFKHVWRVSSAAVNNVCIITMLLDRNSDRKKEH